MTGDASEPWRQEPWHVTLHEQYRYQPPQRLWQPRQDLSTAGLLVVVLSLVAPLIGLLWAHVAPKLDIAPLLRNSGIPYHAQIGDDAWFLLLTALAGAATGFVASVVGDRGPGVLLGLVFGGTAAAAVAARVGFLAQRGHTIASVRANGLPVRPDLLDLLDFKVRALGVAAAWPFAAVLVFVILIALRGERR